MPEINYIAVVVLAIFNMVLGASWYSPVLFGSIWMKLSNMSQEQINSAKQKGMTKNYILAFIAGLVMSFIVGYLVSNLGLSTIQSGALLGFLVWLGFIATTMLNSVLWDNKPAQLYILNISYYLISLVVMGAVFAIWT